MANEIIVISEDRLRQIIKDVIPNGEKLSPEDQFVTTEQLAKIMKVSPQMINTYKGMGMFGYNGENLWEWTESLRWRRDVYSKITNSNRKRSK
jgi:signal transduction histidine kinase